ncbi:hypothetical protein [Paraburkholderia kururiensis]|uniref:hypothetical protein n=1 Tax=Paraburkholderia kururiensis TaxID=984307 RepID=UPI000AA65BC9|nr:hypothetical protein [Paraburkholderia kururiensis]
MKTEFQSDSAEDVSHAYVPGSIGTALMANVPWAPRATPASDRARAEAMATLAPILNRFRDRTTQRAPVRAQSFNTARATFFQE